MRAIVMDIVRPSSLLVALAVAAAAPCHAQSYTDAERWQVTMDDGRILWDVRLVRLADDSLQVSRPDSLATVPVSHMNEIRLIKKTEMTLGAHESEMKALMGADDEVYDLTPLEVTDRLRVVQQIFLHHPPQTSK
ncbi:MAG TPA: hypothetical protein VFW66_04135 [Gemmatimonadales bacterium]|nr:hypothetical protein [Gemmatimonadales bacterium]